MAVRQKTVEYVFPTYTTSVATATRYDFTAITLYLPETTSRTFRSVIVELYVQDNVTTATSITANLVGIKLGAAAFTDVSNTVTITNSGEQCAWIFQTDVTAYFTTNFGAGASQTCQVGCTITGSSTINRCAKVTITYDYEEQDTQVKTVRIPIESATGSLTTSPVEIGTNQIPILDNLLPETSKTIRQAWIELEGNDSCNGTTDFTATLTIDSTGILTTGAIEAGLQSSRYMKLLAAYNTGTFATNAVHALKLNVSSTTGGTADHLAIMLCVTYEYSSTNSTTILNSLALPFRVNPGSTSGAASTEKDLMDMSFFIEEPTTITLQQSGVKVQWQNDAASSLAIMCGSQTARVYADNARVYCGGFTCTHRIDSGSGGGAGISIARGLNTFTLYCYSNQANVKHNAVCGILYLNYHSAKATGGVGVHNHTVIWCGHTKNANLYLVQVQAINPAIPETSYYVNQMGWYATVNKDLTTQAQVAGCAMAAEWAAGEKYTEGTNDLGALFGFSDNEGGVCIYSKDISVWFQRYPGDSNSTDDRMPLEVSRNWYLSQNKQVCASQIHITYHAITRTVSGTITGAGTPANVTWKVHRVDTGEIVATGTNTTVSATWYDNVVQVYVEAYEDGTHIGRSTNDVAT